MKKISIITIFCALLLAASCQKNEVAAKYIFLFIGDGMGASQVALAESYLSHEKGVRGGEQLCFTTFPQLGMCTTYSANSLITDSAASGTAISTGSKTNNGMLGVTPDGEPVWSVAHVLKQEYGYNVGVFSSVPVNHATPAAFYAHNANRSDYYNISKQIPEAGYEFYGGSGFLKFTVPDCEQNSEEYLEECGYEVVFGQAEYEAARGCGKPVVMSSNPEQDHRNTTNYELEKGELVSLEQMMKNCIETLGDKKPFFIICEGGEIDWVCHANQTLPTVQAIIKMDDAVKVAYEFYLKHPKETLILVTADHETGGVSIGSNESGYTYHWDKILESYEKDGILPEDQNRELNNAAGFAWTSRHHNGGHVPIYAIGAGSERFSGRMDNTDIKPKILSK